MKVRTKIIGLLLSMIFIVSCILTLFMLFNISEMRRRGNSTNTELNALCRKQCGTEIEKPG